MVNSCSVVGCTSRKKEGVYLFRLPSEKTAGKNVGININKVRQRQLWLSALRRKTYPADVRVCHIHFITGRPSDDPIHPDFAPSLALGYSRLKPLRSPLKSPSKERLERRNRLHNRQEQFVNTSDSSTSVSQEGPSEIIDPDRLRVWEKLIRRGDRRLTVKDNVCELHFQKSDIERFYENKLPNGEIHRLERGIPNLIEGANPSIFKFRPLSKSKKPLENLGSLDEDEQNLFHTDPAPPLLDFSNHASHQESSESKRREKKTATKVTSTKNAKKSQERLTLDPPKTQQNRKSSTKRPSRRQGKKRKRNEILDETEDDLLTSTEPVVETHSVSISTQVYFDYPDSQFTFVCDRSDSETVGVQCNLPPSANVPNADQCRMFPTYRSVERDDEGLNALCGVNSVTFESLKDQLSATSSVVLDRANVLLLFLMKLRLGLPFAALGILFGVHRGTAKDVFLAVLGKLCSATAGYWPFMLNIKSELPPFFVGKFADVRLIVGCAEIKAQRLDKLEHRIPMYSTRGEHYAFKILLGVNPSGVICYKSKVYCGRTGDAFVAQDSGFLDHLEPGDLILTRSNFPVDVDPRICPIPPLPDDFCCTPEELKLDELRRHVEMCLERVQQFKILHFIPKSLFTNIDAILQMCCFLVNHMAPMFEIRDDEFHLIDNEEL